MSTKLVLALGLSFGVGVTIVGFRVADKMDVKVLIGPHYHQSTNTPPTPTPPVVTNGGQWPGNSGNQASSKTHIWVKDPDSPITSCDVKCDGRIIHSFYPVPSNAQCAKLLQEQGQRRCDAYSRSR
jgi:hypothetical protein